MIKDMILKTRSYRRFDQSVVVKEDELREMVDCARLSASGANMQSLKYKIVSGYNESVFKPLKWAGYLKDWDGPKESERPTGYIVILLDKSISKNPFCDHGIAAQSMLLRASEMGYGGCMFGSIDREALGTALDLTEQYEILLVLALGKPVEEIELEDVAADGDIKYYRDDNGVHHVPKRSLEDIIL